MQGRTRTRHTKKVPAKRVEKEDFILGNEEGSISADEYIQKELGDFPRWAISLSGLRYREDLTQKELGDIIGIAQSNISEMENGIRPIGKNIAKRLAKFFKTDYRYFL